MLPGEFFGLLVVIYFWKCFSHLNQLLACCCCKFFSRLDSTTSSKGMWMTAFGYTQLLYWCNFFADGLVRCRTDCLGLIVDIFMYHVICFGCCVYGLVLGILPLLWSFVDHLPINFSSFRALVAYDYRECWVSTSLECFSLVICIWGEDQRDMTGLSND